MSEQESNTCEMCGGIKRVEYVIGFEEGRPREMRLNAPEPLPETGWRLCPGHPEPAQKHDGKLDEKGKHTVELWVSSISGKPTVDIEESANAWERDHPDHVELTPAQALSLRDWLIQESPELERLAKEQERA